ncbi:MULTISPECIES: glycosyltransferase [Flavobacteriaceae]|uniref:glycosyltransferase n=1 Tax=Flavobacteriaceae TaxID=49546 RepID=UPI001490FA6D|nr:MULTISPECIES: glycosyltransferase [Allomuricauda]MDC6365647.1 glycosyltransferase [Muricauda sp. AC10]
MIKDRDIIVMGIQAWDIEIGSNCKNIAVEMAKNNRVLYVNPPMDRISRYREKNSEKIKKRLRVKKGLDADLVQLEDSLWNLYPKTITESINFLKNKSLFDFFNKINAKRFTNDIQSAIERLEFKDYIIFNDSSMFLGQHIKQLLQPSFYVYYMRDYLTKNPYWRKNGVRLEPKLIETADCVVNNSTLYTEYGRQYTEHSYMVGQGCDTTLFNDSLRAIKVPKDLENIPGPIIGYVGFLTSRRLSIDILVKVAKARPKWSIVLVGPEDDNFKESELHNMSNVHFLGSRDASELPNYIKGFDVAINPQLINDATMGNYPRKIDEYLAMGKPTVASATKAMEYFKDYTYLGETAEDYVALIEKALEENSKELEEKRRFFGLSHSWENNVNEIYNCILKVKKASA